MPPASDLEADVPTASDPSLCTPWILRADSQSRGESNQKSVLTGEDRASATFKSQSFGHGPKESLIFWRMEGGFKGIACHGVCILAGGGWAEVSQEQDGVPAGQAHRAQVGTRGALHLRGGHPARGQHHPLRHDQLPAAEQHHCQQVRAERHHLLTCRKCYVNLFLHPSRKRINKRYPSRTECTEPL